MSAEQITANIDFAQQRRAMVDNQLRPFSVTDHDVLARFLAIPREKFVPEGMAAVAYSDLAIEAGQGPERRRMLPPMILGRMIQAANIGPGDRVLDVGGGLGYGAAIMAGLGAEVIALETNEAAARVAGAALAKAGVANVRTVTGPLEAGFAAGAPYSVILVNGMIEIEPAALLAQLAAAGRLVAIERLANDASGRTGRVMRFEVSGQAVGSKEIFDASAPILPGFARAPAFSF